MSIKKEECIKQLYLTELDLVKLQKDNPILDMDELDKVIGHIDNAIIEILNAEYNLTEDMKEEILDITQQYTEHLESWESYKDILQAILLNAVINSISETELMKDIQKLVDEADKENHIPHID